VYGHLGDGELIPWNRANQTCLEEFNIKVSSIDADRMFAMCPYPNSTDASLQLLFAEFRGNPGPAIKAIQAYYPQFWVESSTTPGTYVLVDTINDQQNNPIECESSENLCWGAIKEYFSANPEAIDTACREFHDRYAFERELEQSTIRIRLCQEAGSTACEPLASQVIEIQELKPNKACSAYGLGPGNTPLPNVTCKAPTTTYNPSTPTSSSFRKLGIGKFPVIVTAATLSSVFLAVV
jgi:hypothetical protein